MTPNEVFELSRHAIGVSAEEKTGTAICCDMAVVLHSTTGGNKILINHMS
jgi:hypothetical protein